MSLFNDGIKRIKRGELEMNIDYLATTVPMPPLGLKPKYIHDKTRIKEILDAMERYSERRFPIPIEWVEELKELID